LTRNEHKLRTRIPEDILLAFILVITVKSTNQSPAVTIKDHLVLWAIERSPSIFTTVSFLIEDDADLLARSRPL
jgi:hypothetical protein